MVIPTKEEERPVKHLNGIIFTNDAWHCRPEDLWPTELSQAEPEWVRWMEIYLANFCRPVQSIAKEVQCVACDAQLTGAYAGFRDPMHRLAVVIDESSPTLEGRCGECGYPIRARHVIALPDGRPIVKLENFPLCYHPSATAREN